LRKTAIAALACALSCLVSASNLDIFDDKGKKIGNGTFKLTRPAGKISTHLVLNLSQQGAKMTMDITSVYSNAGDPLNQAFKMSAAAQGGSFNASSKATFQGRKATIVGSGMGQSSTKTVTSLGPVRDISVIWSTGKVPTVGTSTTYYQLDPMAATFEKTTATYQGVRNVKVGSRTVSAHVITTSGADATKYYFTSKGDLVKLESKQFTLVQR
jgi:hypothetical protein